MHYYQFNIKSYYAATAHLSNEEDLAYRRLLDLYYDTELPITQNNPVVSRRLRVGNKELETVLNEFFRLTENGWVHDHCESIIAELNAFNERQRNNGKLGGRPRKTQALQNKNPKKPTGLPEKPTAKPPITHNPLPITHNQDKKQAAFILPDWIDKTQWDLWMKTRKGKKMIPEQMQTQVAKLQKWRETGLDHAKALADAASAGWQGLFEPKSPPGKRQPDNFADKDYGTGVNLL